MKNRLVRIVAAVILMTALMVPLAPGTAAAGPAPQYTFTTVDFPGSGNTWIWGMNDSADVVGFYRDPPSYPYGPAHGFSRTDGDYASFDYRRISSNTTLIAISNNGRILGDYNPQPYTGGYHWHGFEITREGEEQPIEVPGQDTTVPFHIMPNGAIIGHVQERLSDLTTRHGVLIYPDGSFDISTIPYSQHNDATPNLKVIAGNYVTANATGGWGINTVTHGYVLENGAMTTLDFPGSNLTLAWDINPAGNRVAGSYRIGSVFHGYVAQKRGTDEAWHFSSVDVPGAAMTWVTCGNAGGQLAGSYYAEGRQYGFIATPVDP